MGIFSQNDPSLGLDCETKLDLQYLKTKNPTSVKNALMPGSIFSNIAPAKGLWAEDRKLDPVMKVESRYDGAHD